MLVSRRSVEKGLSSKVDSLAMAWLQQLFALPFIMLTLFFAHFYMPQELSSNFWAYMAVYVVCCAVDIYCYFKALSMADISYVAPLLSLVAVGNIVGAYVVLGQVPSWWGFLGAVLIVAGAYTIHASKKRQAGPTHDYAKVLGIVFILVVVRSYFSNIEVFMLREANPTTFNFYSSLLTIPVLLVASTFIARQKKPAGYWKKVRLDAKKWSGLLLFIGLTYTINMLATYQAKLIGPNAGYVAAVKSAQVLPMMFIGMVFFKEAITKVQWLATFLIICGLIALGVN